MQRLPRLCCMPASHRCEEDRTPRSQCLLPLRCGSARQARWDGGPWWNRCYRCRDGTAVTVSRPHWLSRSSSHHPSHRPPAHTLLSSLTRCRTAATLAGPGRRRGKLAANHSSWAHRSPPHGGANAKLQMPTQRHPGGHRKRHRIAALDLSDSYPQSDSECLAWMRQQRDPSFLPPIAPLPRRRRVKEAASLVCTGTVTLLTREGPSAPMCYVT
mmetsp:Transcript_65888/g.157519  ORF Transcript_65888/g.157519 Transcript_65888/m.157519 type:complete len:214 (-) Transcript_65888:63-704(-)